MSDDLYFKEFEREGADVVRKNLALTLYPPKKAALAAEWLIRRQQLREDIFASEQLRIAESAKKAARFAAVIAAVAATVAIVAAVIAYLK